MKVKQILTTSLVGIMLVASFSGCGNSANSISVITREDGSGTRSAFIELTGVQEKKDGNKIDNTLDSAIVQNSTQAVITGVQNDNTAIGYISLGSLNDNVKVLKVDNVEPNGETIKDGTYKISRAFNIVTKGNLNEVTQNFIDYIMSADGQKIISDEGYVEILENTQSFVGAKGEGNIKIDGSTSVAPVMEKLSEEYKKINDKANIEVSTSDSSTGISDIEKGIIDIGMSSRELSEDEKKNNISCEAIAKDGIAVIINKDNTVDNVTVEQLKKIYTGEISSWDFN